MAQNLQLLFAPNAVTDLLCPLGLDCCASCEETMENS